MCYITKTPNQQSLQQPSLIIFKPDSFSPSFLVLVFLFQAILSQKLTLLESSVPRYFFAFKKAAKSKEGRKANHIERLYER